MIEHRELPAHTLSGATFGRRVARHGLVVGLTGALRAGLVILALGLGCQGGKERPAPAAPLEHPDGLVLFELPGFVHQQTPDGFAFVERAQVRSPRRLEITVARQAPREEPRERPFAQGGVARFAVRELGAGSAGSEYEVRATRQVDGRWLSLMAREQSERGEPDFGWAFEALGRAGLKTAH